jgi:hypothetical protein
LPLISLANIIVLNGVVYAGMVDINSMLININQPIFRNVQSNSGVLTSTFNGKPFKIISGTKTFIYNKKIYYTDSLIFTIDGTIYMPLKSFLENLGYTVRMQYDVRKAIKKSFSYYTKNFVYYVLQGEQNYTYINGIIYLKIISHSYSKSVYIKLYDSLPDDFLAKLKVKFSEGGLNLKIVSLDTLTTKPTIVFKQGSKNVFWINFLNNTNIQYKYYENLGYNGETSYSLAKSIGYDKLIICPTVMLKDTVIGFVYIFTTTSKINLDALVKGINEFYKSY